MSSGNPSPATGATGQGQQGGPGQAGTDRRGAETPERAASGMSGAEEVCTVPEQEMETEETGSGGPSEGSEAKPRKSRCSRSSRAGLLFPVSRVDRQLRSGRFAERVGAQAPVFLAAVLQWVTRQAMDVAGRASKRSKQQCISPSHLQTAVRESSALKRLLRGGVHWRRGGTVPRSQRVGSPSRKRTTTSKKRRPKHRAAPARAFPAVK
ncbi:histone H2A type 1-like [Opisthocomus hoazin]|uniref:histone H2A type 1-like n=1 Tax=Opisthocomus hoazin TaxID=30419 RepID=UPI003F52BF06